jgi:hypothetical protein
MFIAVLALGVVLLFCCLSFSRRCCVRLATTSLYHIYELILAWSMIYGFFTFKTSKHAVEKDTPNRFVQPLDCHYASPGASGSVNAHEPDERTRKGARSSSMASYGKLHSSSRQASSTPLLTEPI